MPDLAGGELVLLMTDHIVGRVVHTAAPEHEAVHAHPWTVLHHNVVFVLCLTKMLTLSLETFPDKHAGSLGEEYKSA